MIMSFIYCIVHCFSYSWGYRKVFEQYAHALHERFPGLLIEGDNYPPPPTKAFIAQALSITKFVLIGLIVSGIDPFTFFNTPTPNIYSWAKQNKVSLLAWTRSV